MIFLIGIMSFANFVFYPLVIGFFIALIIEQVFRSQDKAPEILDKPIQVELVSPLKLRL